MKTGTVKWFNSRKGYGFIKPVDGGFDVYVHIAAVERAGLAGLKEGQKIQFEVVADERTGEIFAENLSDGSSAKLSDGSSANPSDRSIAAVEEGPAARDGVAGPNLMPFFGLLPGRRALR
ncbi:MAG: cold-shock protein [Hyphomicrobiales bacterium]|nr:cold-shock protein [Hyphomicrobiales bacterium]